MAPRNPQFSLYLPRAVLSWDLRNKGLSTRTDVGTLMFADLSGFTALVERMGAKGRVGAEEISEKINGVFERILSVVRDEGGDVLKFGGDASLVLFGGPDHALSAALAALDMQSAMDELPEFGISIGLESGPVELVLVGDRHRDFLVSGPTVQGVLAAEKAAETGEVVVGAGLAAALPLGSVDADDRLVADPDELADLLGDDQLPADELVAADESLDLADFIPIGLRDSLTVAGSHSEHRHVATGFLHASLDPSAPVPIEALAELVETLAESAERHGVAILASDVEGGGIKFLLCAGAPIASHHEEERMLRTLRRVIDRTQALTLKAGVTRGLVFAGDFGAPWRRYYTLLGDSVNLAARLMSVAGPGQILTLDNVIDRSPTRFAIERLPAVMLKGKSKPVSPVVIGAITGVERVDWARFLPLTGRNAVVVEAVESLSAAREGTGGAIDIVGESGIGKTRLLGDLLDRATMVDSHLVLCEQYEAATPFFAAGHLLRGVLGLKPDTEPAEVLTRLDDVLAGWPELAEWRPLLGLPLGLDLPETPTTTSLSDQFRVGRMHEAILELLTALRPDPAVLAVEDAHWIDDASRALFEHLVSVAGDRPWLFVFTRQPGSDWPAMEGAKRFHLGPLALDDARSLVRLAAREMPASDQVIDSIVETSGGHPFFALELLRHADAASLPESVEAVVAERIDRLDARDRQLLRFVSVLGNSFSLELLAEALPEVASSAEDADTWNRLSDFLDVTVFGTVQFRQDLIRVAAYEGLVYRRRNEVHAVVAEAIERQSRRRVNRQASLLSQHYFLAERWDKAWQFSRIAADQALRRGAPLEAVALYGRAAISAEHVDPPADERGEVFESLADAAVLCGDPDRAEEALRSALAGADRPVDRARLERKLGSVRRDRGDFADARQRFADALEIAGAGLDSVEFRSEAAETLVALAGLEHRAGEFAEAERVASQAMVLAERDGASSAFATAALIRLANFEHLDTEPDRDLGAEAMEVFERLGDAHGVAKVLTNEGFSAFFRSDWPVAVDRWERAEFEYRKAGDVIGAATARNNLAEVLADQGRLDQAEDAFLDAQRAWKAASFPIGQALVCLNLGRVAARRRQRAAAIVHIEEARDRFESTGQSAYVAECDVRKVEIDAFAGRPDLVADGLASLGEDSGSATVRPELDRLRAYSLLASDPLDPDAIARALDAASASAIDAGSPYHQALTARLRAEVLSDARVATEAADLLAGLGAADAVGYLVPSGLTVGG